MRRRFLMPLLALLTFVLMGPVAPVWSADPLDEAHRAREEKDLDRALALYRQLGDHREALFWIATVQRWQGDTAGAAGTFSHLLHLEPDHADALVGDARVALVQQDYDRAAADLHHVLVLKPEYGEAQRLLLTTYLRAGRTREAYAWVARVLDGEERIRHQADIAFDLKWYRRAARGYEKLHQNHPNDVEVILALGLAYERMGYLEDARRLYRDGLRMFPEHSTLRHRAGTVARWAGDRATAQKHFDTVLAEHPRHHDALLGRARLEMDRHHLAGATPEPGPIPVGEMVREVASTVAPVDAPVVAETPAAPAPAEPAPVAVPARMHPVVAGETLGTIAEVYLGDSGRWREVWEANPALADPHRIYPGQKLAVPGSGVAAPTGYTVVSGDTLGTIAAVHLGDSDRWREVWRSNPDLSDPHRIEVGQVLRVPSGVPVATAVPVEPLEPVVPEADPVPVPKMEKPLPFYLADGPPGDTGPWGAREWLNRLLGGHPGSYGGRLQRAWVDQRLGGFDTAREQFLALHRERAGECEACAGWLAAQGELRPRLSAGFKYAISNDLDGRSDGVVTPTPVQYRTTGWEFGARQRVTRGLSVAVRAQQTDQALVARSSGIPVYDFDTLTGWLTVTRHFAYDHTLSLSGGRSDFSPDDGASVADRQFGRARLAWDRVAGSWEGHLLAEQGPFLGRSLAAQQTFGLFRERRLVLRGERDISPRSRLFARLGAVDYSDGNRHGDGEVGARFRAGTHEIELAVARGHKLARFLDQGGVSPRLVFVRTHEARVRDHWRRPFPFDLTVSAVARSYEAVDITAGAPLTVNASPSNRELRVDGEAAYAHPALAPFSFGVGGHYARFDRDAFAYDTVNARGVGLFLQMADQLRPCWAYLLRYEWGVTWDEDPANDHFDHHLVRGMVERTLGRHLGANLEARYHSASAFGEHGVRVAGALTWQF